MTYTKRFSIWHPMNAIYTGSDRARRSSLVHGPRTRCKSREVERPLNRDKPRLTRVWVMQPTILGHLCHCPSRVIWLITQNTTMLRHSYCRLLHMQTQPLTVLTSRLSRFPVNAAAVELFSDFGGRKGGKN